MRSRISLLVVAGLSALVAGATAAEQSTGPRGNVVFPAGDKVRGYLRGGETHALQVHLAKGDRYSATLSAKGSNDLLLMHVAVVDPSGKDVSFDARVRHKSGGKKVTVGSFRADKSGTYSVLVTGMGLWEGKYSGASKLRGARRSTFVLPASGATVDVPVAAGSALRLRTKGKDSITSVVVSLPQEVPQSFPASDPLVGTMLGKGLPTSETGTFRFAAPNASSTVKVEVLKPRWKAGVVDVKPLPDDPSRQASFQWILDWVNEQAALPTHSDLPAPATPPVLPTPVTGVGGLTIGVGAPVAVDVAFNLGGKTTLFVGGALDAAGAFTDHAHPVDPQTGTVQPPGTSTPTPEPTPTPAPTPPIGTPPAPPVFPGDLASIPRQLAKSGYYMVGIPTMACSQIVGKSMLFTTHKTTIYASSMRDAPWTQSPTKYPKAISSAIEPLQTFGNASGYYGYGNTPNVVKELPDTQTGPEADPFVRRSFSVQITVDGKPEIVGTISTTARYYVDDHQVDSLLAGKGEYTIAWEVDGSGDLPAAGPWSVKGNWKLEMHLPDMLTPGTKASSMACVLVGSEDYKVGTLTESVSTEGLTLNPMHMYYDVNGTMSNRLSAPDFGLTQTVNRSFLPSRFPWANSGNYLDRYKPVDATVITTVQTVDAVEGVQDEVDEDQHLFDFFLC